MNAAKPPTPPPSALDPGNDAPLRVLVVDDIQSSRETLAGQVARLGHIAAQAGGGSEALRMVGEQKPDVVLLDLLMPDVDGFEVVSRMRRKDPTAWQPIIAVSSTSGDELFAEAVRRGADDYLARPISDELLAAKLRQCQRVLALQRNLRRMAKRQREILDRIGDAVVTFDATGRVVEANLAARALAGNQAPGAAGLDAEALLGLSLAGLRRGGDRLLRTADGREFPARIAAHEWQEEGVSLLTVVIRDQSEETRNERMRDEFIATVSHELRTPLTSVIGAVALLESGAVAPLPEAVRPLLEAASRNGRRLSQLVDDILDLTKLEADRLVLRLREQALWPLLAEAVAANEAYARSFGVSVKLVQGSTSGQSEDCKASVDADRFLQVLANLISNAVKHSPPGEAVALDLQRDGDGWRVTVVDRGPGVPEAFRAQLFDKFTQADASDARQQAGTGLGLYVARRFAERMGGRLEYEPARGGGSCFMLWLPDARAGIPARPWRVLVLDLDPAKRERVADALADCCAVTVVASTAEAAGGSFDIVLANPQGQGALDLLCARLRAQAGHASILIFGQGNDPSFATSQGFEWLPVDASAEAVRAAVIARLSEPSPRRTTP